EVCRLYGVDRIPATPPRGAIGANAYDSLHDQIAEARRILTGLGLSEAQGQTLISKAEAGDPRELALVALGNPLSSDMDVLRPSLVPGLLNALRHNVHHKTGDVALFEIGRVFQYAAGASGAGGQLASVGALKEERRLGVALTGRREPPFWSGEGRDARFDFYDLKGLLEEFCEQFGLGGITWTQRSAATHWFPESAIVQLGG